MLNDLAILIEAEDIDPGPIVVAGPLLVTVQHNVISLCNDSFELHAFPRVLQRHAGKVLDERFLAVRYCGVVLDVQISSILLDGLLRLALIEHQVVEGDYRRLIFVEVMHE